MELINSQQEFSEKNSLYIIVFDFLALAQLKFGETPPTEISKNYIKKTIKKNGILVNGEKVNTPTTKIANGDNIQFLESEIHFICVYNPNYVEPEDVISKLDVILPEIIEEKKPETHLSIIDSTINSILFERLLITNVTDIPSDKLKLAFAIIIKLIQDYGFDQIKTSIYSYDLTDFIKNKVLDTNIPKELCIQKSQINFAGKLTHIAAINS